MANAKSHYSYDDYRKNPKLIYNPHAIGSKMSKVRDAIHELAWPFTAEDVGKKTGLETKVASNYLFHLKKRGVIKVQSNVTQYDCVRGYYNLYNGDYDRVKINERMEKIKQQAEADAIARAERNKAWRMEALAQYSKEDLLAELARRMS
jgi:DNA-binding transcriptional regulator LsrR (DeoR family)